MNLSFVRTVTGLVVASACLGEGLSLHLVTKDEIDARLSAGIVAQSRRQAAIHDLFVKAGCEAEDQPVDRHTGNVICTLRGQTDAVITVGSHFDFVDRGTGIVDDWSGAAVLPSLFEALEKQPHKNTFVFVAFAREEEGLVGSSKYVKSLSREEKQKCRAFVNLECLGLSTPKVWVRRADPSLLQYLITITNSASIPLSGVDVDNVGDDDTHPFMDQKIPVITIHSITPETYPILHSSRDNISAINPTNYFLAYRLAAFYLAFLDLKL